MASEYFVNNLIVQVRLFNRVDGFDIMSVHGDEQFLSLVREYKNVVYNYADTESIVFSLDDAKSFAKLAAVESKITSDLIIGVIPKDNEHRKSAALYQSVANDLGANVVIIDKPSQIFKND